MLNNDKEIQDFFQQKKHELDTEEMSSNHEAIFLAKLKKTHKEEQSESKWTSFRWKYLSVAASVIILLGIAFTIKPIEANVKEEYDVIPEEIASAELYFQGLINNELEKLESSKNEHTIKLVEDVVKQIQRLEKEYKALQTKLIENYDRRVVKAMISNFQTRIDLLNQVLEQVESINQIKNDNYENSIL